MSLTLKKIGALSLVTAALISASWDASADAARSATVNITATIAATTCTPSWSGAKTVKFGTVAAADLATAKTPASFGRTFTLSLSDCDASISKVDVSASGSPSKGDDNAFANAATGSAATGVAALLKGGPGQDKALLPDGSNSVTYDVKDQKADMTFLAQLENDGTGTGGAVTNGDFSTSVTLNMVYE